MHLRQDLIYTGWRRAAARRPSDVAIVIRETMTINVVTGLVP